LEIGRGALAAIISIASQIIGLMLGLSQVPILNPVWTQQIFEKVFPQIPFIGQYLSLISVTIWSVILSILIVYIVAFWLLGQVSGNLGIALAVGLGALIVMLWYGLIQLPFTLSG